jgi:prepilin-type N-terminal cleavage/methylation domain-containing protein
MPIGPEMNTQRLVMPGISNLRAKRGFTVLELLVTMALAAILAAIAAPGMIDFVRNNKLSAKPSNATCG